MSIIKHQNGQAGHSNPARGSLTHNVGTARQCCSGELLPVPFPDAPAIDRLTPAGFTQKCLVEVLQYKNVAVLARIKKELDVTDEKAAQLFDGMLRFLWLCGTTTTSQTPPSGKVDKAWHIFIIFTKDYAAFCDKYFARFIHHIPTSDEEMAQGIYCGDCYSCRTD